MKRFCAILGPGDSAARREQRIREALQGEPGITIVHPRSDATLAWTGGADPDDWHVADGESFAAAFGSAHVAPGFQGSGPVRVDRPRDLCRHVLERLCAGLQPLDGLAGAFLMIGADPQGRFFAAGDPSGGRQPYVATQDGELVVANHPVTCARLAGGISLDRSFEDFLLVYGFLPDGRTPFEGVRALPAGQCLRNGPDGWSQAALPAPAAAAAYAEVPSSHDELLDRLHEVMQRCLQEQLAGVDEVGVLLGGFDSALVASMLHRLGKKVRTYSFRYPQADFNQPHTDTLAAFLGTRHEWVDITPDVIADGLARYGQDYVQPTNWLNYVIQTTHVCRRMREDGIAYAYSGDGCDAVFLGYPGTYQRTRTFARLPMLPPWLAGALLRLAKRPGVERAIGHPWRIAKGLLRATLRPMPARAFLSFRVLDEDSLDPLRQGERPAQAEPIESILARLAAPHAGASIQRLGYAAKGLVSPNRAKMLAAADTAGVVVHAPYLHPGLRSFAAKIPDALIREESQSSLKDPGKACLMRMAHRHQLLPPEVIEQRKLAAIDSPIDEWFAGPLAPALEAAFSGLPFRPGPAYLASLVRTTAAERFYKRHVGSTRVISDAASLLATYGALCAQAREDRRD